MTNAFDRLHDEWLVAVRKLGRAPKEWVGKHPDSVPPGTVRDRILRTWESRCYLSGVEIRGSSFELEHVIPVHMEPEKANRESNLRPALALEHKKKTRREMKEKAAADRARRAHNGTKAAPSKKIESPGFAPVDKSTKATGASKPIQKKEPAARVIEKLAALGPSNLARRFR